MSPGIRPTFALFLALLWLGSICSGPALSVHVASAHTEEHPHPAGHHDHTHHDHTDHDADEHRHHIVPTLPSAVPVAGVSLELPQSHDSAVLPSQHIAETPNGPVPRGIHPMIRPPTATQHTILLL